MKYGEFKKTQNLELRLLLCLHALEYSSHIFDLDNYPDFDLSNYDKSSMQTYFFTDDLQFPTCFSTILRIENLDVRLFHWDDLTRLAKKHNVRLSKNSGYADTLRIMHKNGEDLADHGLEPDFEGFQLNEVKVTSFNNNGRVISVLGGYEAESMWIQPYDCKFIMFCDILGIPRDSTEKFLHLALIAEGFALIQSENYKLSFFILLTCIECFINAKLGPNDDRSRLAERFQQLFVESFPAEPLKNHQIYSSVAGEFPRHIKTRNKIAHGASSISLGEAEARQMLIFSLLVITTIDKLVTSFDELRAILIKTEGAF